ncbi:protein-L-isoaspartate(D-aspartate) O-methyltransferase [Haloactinospora alba]|uniref:Protein-L-isoaspartate O-methyltransferase n=2 Tax=Haloactinospora alba TaxID=405555 RepID=A0A543NF03_9ACTN|nr:protein-L-isoaspartate(D-aspartate) O-methyltransferase [Haloactinospora alba]
MGEESPPGPENLAELTGDDAWKQALRDVPREWFVPERAWTTRTGLLERESDPDAWNQAVYTDAPIVTQIDDGSTELTNESPWMTTNHSSSCSAPRFVVHFLDLLAPYFGDRVLEVGTGTGWTAGLLSARLGGDNITSIEVDERVADHARTNLERAGLSPHLVVGDGQKGHPEGAPFDRVHVTCGVREIPYAWVEQTRPGGVIVLPWMHGALDVGHKAKLIVTGNRAVGRFHGECAYMMLRSQREPTQPIEGEVRESEPTVDPRRIAVAGSGLSVWIAGAMPGVSVSDGNHRPDGAFRMVAWDRHGESHARVDYWPEEHSGRVRQRGPRDLWQELEQAYLAWIDRGGPGIERFGLTIDASGQRVWLDRPECLVERMG